MRITVHYLAQIKRAAGCGSEAVELPERATLRDLLAALAGRHEAAFASMLLEDNEPRRSLLFFVGDVHAEPGRVLRDGDEVAILAPMAGG